MKGPRCPEGAGMRAGGQAVPVVSPAGQEGGRGSTLRPRRIILPFWVFPPCLLCFVAFSFSFFNRRGVSSCISIHSP